MLRRGGEPLPHILQTVERLAPGQSLRLLATFEPLPLYAVLGRKGYGHQARALGNGDWEVLFTPGGQQATPQDQRPRRSYADTDTTHWPAPTTTLDNRGLEPPEPLVRILETLEQLPAGSVLEAINERDPVFLYPELETRGAAIKTETQADGSVRILIRRGAAR